MSTRRREQGFSLIEVTVGILIVLIVSAMAIIALNPTKQQFQADAAMVQVASQLRKAREIAIEQRRDVLVSFDTSNNTITLTQQNLPAGSTVLSTIPIQVPAQFMLMPGMPDTPDAFGKQSAIYFEGISGGPVGMGFQSDGTFIDGAGNLVNGTVFLGIAGVPSSARAITVLGATGKIRMYKAIGSGWQQ
jgi:prepilin-type N-terminal cleavage/methylation domain-containing protein